MRNRVVPVDPATADQMTIRARMSAAMTAWQALPQTNRDAWDKFAQGTPWHNALGQECRLTSVNMYLSIRLAALQILPALPSASFDDPPCTPGLFPQNRVTISTCTSGILEVGFNLAIVNNHPTDTIRLGVQRSTAQSLSVNFWKGPYVVRDYWVSPPVPPSFGIDQDFIRLTLNKRYFLRYRILNVTSNNIVSSPWHDSVVATPCTA